MSVSVTNYRPQDIAIDRAAATVTIKWADRHVSVYRLDWLRANCPCATCREERWEAGQESDEWSLSAAQPPTAELAGADLVGGYAIQFEWADGHSSGIYSFAALRRSCPCEECNADGPPADLG